MIGKRNVSKYPALAMGIILAGATLFGVVMEKNKDRLESNRQADAIPEEQPWEPIIPMPTQPGIYRFYNAEDDLLCTIAVGFGQGDVSVWCIPASSEAESTHGIERIPWPTPRERWGA